MTTISGWTTRVDPRVTVALLTGVGGALVAALQLRGGIVPLFDTVTYWSGARATSNGQLFTTHLAPGFSNFDAVEFVERQGRLPFVDFPAGYPTVAGILGVLVGVRAALVALTIAAMACVAALVALGPDQPHGGSRATRQLLWALAGIGVVSLPASRFVTQGILSEPAFLAVTLGLVLALLRYRQTGSGWPLVVAMVIAAGLLRFIGAPLAVLAGGEHLRRHRRPLAALGWTALGVAPAAANALWAAAAGGGHSPGWRGLSGDTTELVARSVGGWFDATQGDLRLTYFSNDGAAWWAWPLTVVWLAAVIWSVVGLAGSSARRLPAPLELCLAAAGIITAGLVAGMLYFDALVKPDNRLMLPAGVLTLAGVVWSAPDVSRRWVRDGPMLRWALAGALVLWSITAVRPWNLAERFTDDDSVPAYVAPLVDVAPAVLVTNAADGLHWHTGIPSAYAPRPVKELTGERVDYVAIWRALPCPLLRAGGVIVLIEGAFFGSLGEEVVIELVDEGRLVAEALPGAVMYVPTPDACR